MDKKTQLIHELEKLHREQRGWHRLVHDEQLDIDYLRTLSIEELEELVEYFEQIS